VAQDRQHVAAARRRPGTGKENLLAQGIHAASRSGGPAVPRDQHSADVPETPGSRRRSSAWAPAPDTGADRKGPRRQSSKARRRGHDAARTEDRRPCRLRAAGAKAGCGVLQEQRVEPWASTRCSASMSDHRGDQGPPDCRRGLVMDSRPAGLSRRPVTTGLKNVAGDPFAGAARGDLHWPISKALVESAGRKTHRAGAVGCRNKRRDGAGMRWDLACAPRLARQHPRASQWARSRPP